MDSVENYARQWAKREKDFDTLSKWMKSVRLLIQNYVASRIIYEWGTCTGATRRLRFEIVNIEIM
jgi:hypothetical protein